MVVGHNMSFFIPHKPGAGAVSKLRFFFFRFAVAAAAVIFLFKLAEEFFKLRPEDITEIKIINFVIRGASFSFLGNENINNRRIYLFIKISERSFGFVDSFSF